MWLASEMAAFAHVSELKSFTAAARALGVPKVAVSRAIVSLERRLGARLLIRTTRRVSLTAAGELLRPHCQRLLAEVEAVRSRFGPAGSADRRLRLVVDAGYGRLLVTPLVPRFLEHYPQIELTVGVLQSAPAAPGEDWDLLVGADLASADVGGEQERSGTLTRTALGRPVLILCATPGYLARHAPPRTPADLAAHAVLQPGRTAPLELARGNESHQVRLRPALEVDDPALAHASAAAGLGIGVLPEFLCRQGLAMGKLVRVLPDWTLVQAPALQALYASARAGSAPIRQFLEFLLANLVPVLSRGDAASKRVTR